MAADQFKIKIKTSVIIQNFGIFKVGVKSTDTTVVAVREIFVLHALPKT